MSDEKPVDLGYANGWGSKPPDKVIICQELKKHKIYSENKGRCLTQYGCEICGYYYLVDSSD